MKSYGKQNYQCKDCKRQFIGDHALTYQGCHSKIEEKIRLMTVRGCGVRDIALIASVSIGKVLSTIDSSVYKITPKKRYYERLEVDEFWTYVYRKKRKVWLIYAYDRATNEIVAYVWGKRDFSLPARRVIRSLNQLIEYRGKPVQIRCDNGPEYISHALKDWADQQGITISYIEPGNPQQNAYVERFNRTMRYDWLNQELFDNLEQVRAQAENWLYHYNHERPNMGNGGFTPIQKLNQAA
ncbi:IS1 family transposase [Psychrobacter jeotgali]